MPREAPVNVDAESEGEVERGDTKAGSEGLVGQVADGSHPSYRPSPLRRPTEGHPFIRKTFERGRVPVLIKFFASHIIWFSW